MGLDMYLEKRTYIGATYKHQNITGEIKILKDGKPISIDLSRLTQVEERIGYWRKANHIHKWFVDNCQEGVDDCREAWVSEENLIKLIADCKQALENKENASSILPTQGGFFFGGTDYDEYYFSEIEDTLKFAEIALSEYKTGDIYYSSSW